ncbi:MAG: RNA polymerase sigma factor [Lachnospiraceae bacterium]
MKCDANTFAQMYEAVYKELYRFALCIMRQTEDAEDAVSEAVISAYEHVHKLRNQEAFKSWIFTILSNVCKKKLMNRAGKDRPIEEYESAGQNDIGLPLEIKQAFFILSEEEQLIVALSVFGGYNSTEIGKIYGLNANTVRSKRKRALEKMGCVLNS